jgi:Putative zinc-finger
MSALTCRATRRALEAYHDGELNIEEQVAVQTHLRRCPTCASERQRLARLSATVREAAAADTLDEAESLGRQVLARLPERSLSWGQQVKELFDDMHLVWAAMGATLATIACLAAAIGIMRLMLREQPTSMAAVIGALADPGSNQNPVSLDGRMLLPTTSPEGFVEQPIFASEDAVFTLAAVVTREGRVSNLALLQDDGRTPLGNRAVSRLLGAAGRTKFEPARARGTPVAVNMVWLLAQTRVTAKPDAVLIPVPVVRPRTPSPARAGVVGLPVAQVPDSTRA